MEQLVEVRPLQEVLSEVGAATPQLLNTLRPANAKDQRISFLADEIDEPTHEYDKLAAFDFRAADEQLAELGQELQWHPAVDAKLKPTYAAYIDERRAINALMQTASILNSDEPEEVKAGFRQVYAGLNERLYGTVDMEAYQTLVARQIREIRINPQDAHAVQLLGELRGMFSSEDLQSEHEPYRPDEQTFQVVSEAATELYSGLTRHIPDREAKYSPEEIAEVLDNIVHEEFGTSAEGWQVVRVDQKGLSVNASKKEVRVSKTISQTAEGLRGLVVHELGVHMLRAIRGSETDLLPMELGFAGYAAAEEGLGMVMQQAITGKYEVAGAGHYITAGFVTAGHSFRETFKMKWRMHVLQNYDAETGIRDEDIAEAREKSFTAVMRILRGTDSQPLLKDLSYYNGTQAMWKYFERYADDEFMLNLALLGKLDPSQPEQIRAALESRDTGGLPENETEVAI